MMMAYRPRSRIWTPSALDGVVVSLADMKSHLRVVGNHDDADILAIEQAAVRSIENQTQRLLVRREAVLRLPDLPRDRCPIELPGGPVSTVTSIVADSTTITGHEVIGDAPARLLPDADWPVLDPEGYPVAITYTVGYDDVPADLVHAVKLLAGTYYENRESIVIGSISSELPLNVRWLIDPYRIWAAS